MKRVVTAAILVAAVLCALFLLPPIGWGFVVLAIVTAGAVEWGKLIGLGGGRLACFAGGIFLIGAAMLSAATPAADRAWQDSVVFIVCGLATLFWVAAGTPSVLLDWQPRSTLLRVVAGGLVLLGAFVAVVELQSRSPWLVLAAMAIVWIADTAAYFAGRRFGRHKLAPRISPGKTWEGVYGALAAVAVYALALVPLAAAAGHSGEVSAVAVGVWVACALVLVALSVEGDLFESLLKRHAE